MIHFDNIVSYCLLTFFPQTSISKTTIGDTTYYLCATTLEVNLNQNVLVDCYRPYGVVVIEDAFTLQRFFPLLYTQRIAIAILVNHMSVL